MLKQPKGGLRLSASRQGRVVRWLATAVVLGGALFFCLVPRLYYVVKPGFALDAGGLLPAATLESGAGQWLYTAILAEKASAAEAAAAYLLRGEQVMDKRSLLGGLQEQDYMAGMDLVMEASQGNAAEAAYSLAGKGYSSRPQMIVVMEGGSLGSKASFAAGDAVAGCQGSAVGSIAELAACLEKAAPSGEAVVELKRGTVSRTVKIGMDAGEMKVYADSLGSLAAPGIASSIASGAPKWGEVRIIEDLATGRSIEWKQAAAGGPSAGLMMALALHDDLMPGAGTGGLIVAGTGTISPDGKVGPVGGVAQKVQAAAAAGADLFLVPAEELRAAETAVHRLRVAVRIVEASTLQEAIEAVEAAVQRRK